MRKHTGPVMPANDKGPTVAAAAPEENAKTDDRDFAGAALSGQALLVIEGEGRAAQYLARLQAQQADQDELALIVSMLYGAKLRGFCRVIEKALGAHHA
jgi:hypothetical protein